MFPLTLTAIVTFIIALVLIGCVVWAIYWFLDAVLHLPAPLNMIAKVIVGLIAFVMLLNLIGIHVGVPM